MKELIRFVVNYEMGIYIILGVLFLINLQRLIRSLVKLRKANFGLEKEVAQKGVRSSVTFISLVALFAVANFILVSVASIRFPGIVQLPTPTIDILATPEPDSGEDMGINSDDFELSTTQTAIALSGCVPEQLEWINPSDGDEISGAIELIGTVNFSNMGFFKYEYRYQADTIWTPISAGNRPIVDGPLGGVWNTEQLIPGNYFLRLVVSDNANNLLEPCEITVKVIDQ